MILFKTPFIDQRWRHAVKFNKYFDKAYCINLDRRKDRWADCKKEFNKIGISPTRVSAIDGNEYPQIPGIKAGALGCKMSHLKVITMAKNNGYEKIFIAEDDIVFIDNFNQRFETISSNIPEDWNFIYLAANPHSGDRFQIADGISKMVGGYSSHAMLINSNIFDLILDSANVIHQPIDVVYAIIQHKVNCYVTIPHLAFQREGFSDVENVDVNYEFFKV